MRDWKAGLVAVGLALLAPLAVQAQGYTADSAKKVDEYLTRLERWGFSGAVVLGKDGKIVLAKGYGLADRERGIPFTENTVSTVGSITKQFTAAAILKLEMMGKLRVEELMSKYIPGVPDDKKNITLHHLLTHTAGFPGAIGDDEQPIGREEFLEQAFARPLEFPPGQRFEYSNVGYSLLGIIVELVAGTGYEKFLREHLLLPAGMQHTGYVLPKFGEQQVAVGYREGRTWGRVLNRSWRDDGPGWHLRANGGIHSTALDMYKWHVALEEGKILSAAAREKFFAPHVAEGPEGRVHYAYGWSVVRTQRSTRLVTHNGGNGTFFADFFRYVDEGVAFYIHSNARPSAVEVTRVLPRVLFGYEYQSPPALAALSPEQLRRAAGVYRLPSGETLEVTATPDGLKLSSKSSSLSATLSGLQAPAGRSAELAERSRRLIEANARGDYRLTAEAFGGMPLAEVERQESRMWQDMQARWGKFTGVEAVGVESRGMVRVLLRIRFERGEQLIRFGWEGERLAGVMMVPEFPGPVFHPESETEFVAFDLSREQWPRLRFSAARGTLTGLTLILGDKQIEAARE